MSVPATAAAAMPRLSAKLAAPKENSLRHAARAGLCVRSEAAQPRGKWHARRKPGRPACPPTRKQGTDRTAPVLWRDVFADEREGVDVHRAAEEACDNPVECS